MSEIFNCEYCDKIFQLNESPTNLPKNTIFACNDHSLEEITDQPWDIIFCSECPNVLLYNSKTPIKSECLCWEHIEYEPCFLDKNFQSDENIILLKFQQNPNTKNFQKKIIRTDLELRR